MALLLASQSAQGRSIHLMTVSPGTEFWSVYGHTALVIDEHVYGFGVFSFEQSGFFQAFLKNQMHYEMGVTDLDFESYWAEKEQRDLFLQPLLIDKKQQDELIAYLRWHWQPENRTYAYDYFSNNCATKIRDLLNQATDGTLKASSQTMDSSFFEETFPVKNQSLMNLGLALGYGHAAYQPRSVWELMAFPEVLQKAMTQQAMQPFVGETTQLVAASDQQAVASWLKTHAALLIWTVAWVLFVLWPVTRQWAVRAWVVSSALLSVVLLGLWWGTDHHVAAWNINVLLFLPWLLVKLRWAGCLILFATLAWVPVSLWQGSTYIWPMALINVLMVLLGRVGSFHKR